MAEQIFTSLNMNVECQRNMDLRQCSQFWEFQPFGKCVAKVRFGSGTDFSMSWSDTGQ